MHNQDTGLCWALIATLALLLGRSDRTVQASLAALIRFGLVERIKRNGRSSLFRLNLSVFVKSTPESRRRPKQQTARDDARQLDLFADYHPENCTPEVQVASPQGCEQLHPEASFEPSVEDSQSLRSARPPLPSDARTLVWQEGLSIVLRLTGRPQGACRRLVGVLLKHLRDDCAALLELLRETEQDRRIAPVDWLIAAAKHRGSSAGRRRDAVDELLAGIDAYEARMKAGGNTSTLAWAA